MKAVMVLQLQGDKSMVVQNKTRKLLKATKSFNQKATNMQMAGIEIYLNQLYYYNESYFKTLIQAPTSAG